MAGYTRQSAGNIADNAVIQASDLNAEFDALASAFDSSTGHDHNGAGDGARITVTGPGGEYTHAAGALTPSANAASDLGSGSLRWKDAYLSGTVNAASVAVSSNLTAAGVTVSGSLTASSVSLSSALPVSSGGTGAATASAARTALGLGSVATATNSDGVAEGSTNLYHTSARVRAALSATTPISFNASTGVFSLASTLDANARVGVGINTSAITGTRRNIRLIAGSNITLTATDDPTNEEVDVTVAASSTASLNIAGDVTGNTGAATVVALRGRSIASTTPSDGQVYQWSSASSSWVPSTPAAAPASYSLGGDLSGTTASATVTRLQGRSVSSSAPSTNQVLAWNGSNWAPATPSSAPASYSLGGDLSGTTSSATVIALQGRSVSNNTPSSGQVLGWNGSNWTPTAVATLGANTFSGAQTATGFGISGGLNLGPASLTFSSGNSIFFETSQVQIAAGGTARLRVGTSEVTSLVAISAPSYITTSDRALKKDIVPITGALDRVLAYEPVTFRWDETVEWATPRVNSGFIAQDVELVNPLATVSPGGIASIDAMALIADLVGAIKTLEARLAAVEAP